MRAQLQEIRADFEAASARLQRLREALTPAAWQQRPPGGGWCAAECVAHLNLTSAQFLPLMRAALETSPSLPPGSDRRLRRDLTGWLLWRIMPPPVRFVRSRTTPAFTPAGGLEPAALVAEFDRLQNEQLALLEQAGGRAIDRVFIRSPFDARAKYNLFACLGILARHQHRHLWQGEQAARAGSATARAGTRT